MKRIQLLYSNYNILDARELNSVGMTMHNIRKVRFETKTTHYVNERNSDE